MLRFVVPAYNEETNIKTLLEKTRAFAESLKEEYQLIVVNDGSTDATMRILAEYQKKMPVVILDQVTNKGPGEAFKRAFKYIAEKAGESDIVVTKEADNTSDLGVLSKMLEKINSGYDLALASCYMAGGGVEGTNIYRKILSSGANMLLRIISPPALRGIHTYSSFYRAYRASLIKRACDFYGDELIEEKGFTCMIEMLVKLARLNIKIAEVPMVLRGDLRKGRSKMKTGKTIAAYLRFIYGNLCQNR